MTSQERVWFDQLASKRANAAAVFADPDYSGFWNSVVEKYSDNAHFICELLQNADDAGATEASFELDYGQEVVFRHNGGKRFTVSNPATSHKDQINGVLGCVNAITAIGQSEKIVEEKAGNQIGKFGIGFKSVFRYTETPQIYDDNVCFYLHSKIVPVLLTSDYPSRKRGETVFVLPLNKPGLDFDVASREIEDSVKKLQFPTLFLNHLVRVTVRIFRVNELCLDVVYIKQQLDCKVENIPAREAVGTCLIRLCKEDKVAKTLEVVDVRTMVRCNVFGLPYAVGFAVDQNGRPRPLPLQNAYCYFKTDVQTGLPFLVHAPFRLTDNRQGFLSDPINADFLMRLAILSADAMLLFRDWKLLDESIFTVFPSDLVRKKVLPSFEVFLRPFINLVQQEAIYPSVTGYVSRQKAKWAETKAMMDLLPLEKLQKLTNGESSWVFSKCFEDGSSTLEAVRTWLDISGIAIKFTGVTLLNSITASHVKCFGVDWLNLLYGYILNNPQLIRNAMLAPLIIDNNGNVVAAKNDKGENRVYLPIENVECDLPTVNLALMKQSNAITFFKRIGLCEPSGMDAIKKIITDKLQKAHGREEYNRLFKQVLDFYVGQKYAERQVIVKLLQENPCIAVKDFDDIGKDVGCSLMKKGEIVYFPNDELAKYFKALGVRCVDWERYIAMTGDKAVVDSLLTKIGVFKDVRFWRNSKDEPSINMCMANLRRIMSLPLGEQKQLSVVIWHILCNVVSRCCSRAISFQQLMTCVHHNAKVPSPTLQMLRSTKWLINNDGAMVASNEVWRENLAAEYDLTSWQSIQIIEALQIKRNPELVAIETLTDENRAALNLGQKLRAAGFDKKVDAGVSAEKLRLLLQLGEKFTGEEIKSLLNGGMEAKCSIAVSAVTENAERIMHPTAEGGIVQMAVADHGFADLARDEQESALSEAKEMAIAKLKDDGFDVPDGGGSNDYTLIRGVVRNGEEYPVVVRSYCCNARPFELTPNDWEHLMKPRAILMVRTRAGVCYVPFKDLISGREKLVMSFSTENLDIKGRLNELGLIMRWFKKLHFDFGSLIPMRVGTAQLFDLPENQLSEEDKVAQMKPDNEQEVL